MGKAIVSKSVTPQAACWDGGGTNRMGRNQEGEERRCQQMPWEGQRELWERLARRRKPLQGERKHLPCHPSDLEQGELGHRT